MAERKKTTSIRSGTSRHAGGEYVGKKIDAIRKALKGALNIPAGANSLVAGEQVNASYVLKEGDTLEFVKPAGRHGRASLASLRSGPSAGRHG